MRIQSFVLGNEIQKLRIVIYIVKVIIQIKKTLHFSTTE